MVTAPHQDPGPRQWRAKTQAPNVPIRANEAAACTASSHRTSQGGDLLGSNHRARPDPLSMNAVVEAANRSQEGLDLSD